MFLADLIGPYASAVWERPPEPGIDFIFGPLTGAPSLEFITVDITGNIPAGYDLLVLRTPEGQHGPLQPIWNVPASDNLIWLCEQVESLVVWLVRDIDMFLADLTGPYAYGVWERH